MASSSISSRQKNISLEFIKKTAGYIAGATGGFISDVMPTTSSTISGAKTGLQELNSTFSNTTNSILPKISQLKNQGGFKNITNWFMQREDDYSDTSDNSSDLTFDVDADNNSSVLAEAQISESTKSANQISRTVLESSAKLVEAQVSATANLIASTDRQTAVISSGFDKTNDTLNKILEVVTKNTSALIETTVVSSIQSEDRGETSNDKLASGKFRFGDYRKMVTGNLKNSEFGMISGMISMVSSMGGMLTPKELIQYGISQGVGKFAPKLKNNMKALDDAVGDTIMGSLIRLGEHRNEFGFRGRLAQVFGIDSTRKDVSTQKSSLELKNMEFNSLAQEALVGAIPGYLRHLLIAVGGPDLAYDFKSRSFKNNNSIRKEFDNQAISSVMGSLNNAGGDIKKSLGDDKFSHMVYDLMMNDLGTKTSNGVARNTISKFGNKQETQDYILQTVLSGMQLSDAEVEAAKKFSENLGNATIGMGSHQMMNQVTRNNVNRNKNMERYVREANDYGMDLSFIDDNPTNDRNAIAKSYGKNLGADDNTDSSKASVKDSVAKLSGVNYTNMALYEIYRRLNEGINVFQVGKSNHRKTPFKKFGDDYLVRPLGHKPKQTGSNDLSSSLGESTTGPGGVIHDDGSDNLLQNQTLEDGSVESLSGGQRFTRWGKQRGGNLAKAMFSGGAQQVKESFGLIVRDVTQIGGEQIKKGIDNINTSFGDVAGFIRHKFIGGPWVDPITGKSSKGEDNGYVGKIGTSVSKIFLGTKEDLSKGIKYKPGVFDLFSGKSSDDPNDDIKRKKIIGATAGIFTGAQMGIIGGPIGMIIGGLMGSSIATSNIGSKISKMLLGDSTDSNKSKGLFSKIGNKFKSFLGYNDNMSDEDVKLRKRTQSLGAIGGIIGASSLGLVGGPLGMVVTGLAGAALSTSDIGPKIQKMIFGEKDASGKRKGGIVNNVINPVFKSIKSFNDIITAPFKLLGKTMGLTFTQTSKTLSTFNGVINKKILDPISDIFFVAKERVKKGTNSFLFGVKDKFGKQVGGLFSPIINSIGEISGKIKNSITGFFSKVFNPTKEVIGSILKGTIASPFALARMGFGVFTQSGRQNIKDIWSNTVGNSKGFGNIKGFSNFLTNVGTGNVGEGNTSIANILAGNDDDIKSKLELRRSKRNKSVESINEEIADTSIKTEENTSQIKDDISLLTREATTEGSLFTHDEGLHGRIDRILEAMGAGNIRKKPSGTSDADKAFVDSTIGAVGSLISSDGVNMEEAKLSTEILDEAAKNNPSKSSVVSKFKNLIGIQSKRKSEDPEKKESFLDKILNNWKLIAGGIVAGLALLNGNVRKIIGNIGSNLLEAGKELWRWIKDGDKDGNKDGNNSNAPLNALTAPLDMRTDNALNYLNPFADINHVKTDAAGNDITNINATRAKDAPWYHLGVQGITRGTSSVGYRMDANKQLHYAEVADDLGWQARSDKHLGLAAKAEAKAAERAAKPFGRGGGVVGKGLGTLGVGLGGGQLVGKAVGGITSKVLQNYGVDEEWADRGGRVAETIGTIRGTSYVTKKAANIAVNGTDNKLIKWAMDHSIKVLESLGEKVGASKSFAAAAKPISEFISKAKGSITEKALVPLTETIIKLAAKCGVQVSAGVVTAGIANAIIAAGGGIIQGCNTENLFGVSPGQADGLMTTVATGLGALFNLPFVCLVEIIDIVLAPVNDGKGVRQSFAEIIYNTLKGDGGATLSEKQSSLQGDVDDYNKKYGTSLDKATYNDMVNQGIMDKIWTGGTKMKDGHAVFKDNGERDTNGGIKGGLDYVGAKISNEYNYAKNKIGNEVTYVSNKADEFWNGKNLVDENGKEVVDEDGKPVKTGGLKDWGMKTIGKFTSTIGTIFTGVGSIAKDWWAGEYERDENGDPLVDENGNPVRKGGLKDWALGGINKAISTITTPIGNMAKAVGDWINNESAWASQKINNETEWVGSKLREFWNPISDSIDNTINACSNWLNNESAWIKGGFNSVTDYISDRISNFFSSITEPINQFVDGAKEWVTNKADWGINGIKDWIAKKSDQAWDFISTPFKGLLSKGKQEEKDQAAIANKNKNKQGGGLDENVRPLKQRVGGIGGPAEAGDPLNKPVKVTSPFGERIHPISKQRKFHKGIDLVPVDGGDAQVGAVYGGKVTAVGYEAGGAGNYVFYQTPDGMTVKNMHMKDGSIPGNITEGATIKAGDKLGDMGSTGGSTGPHLHYQIEKNGQAIDPAPFVDGSKSVASFNGGSGPGGSNESQPAGPLAALLGGLQNAGSAYLNKISGGLMGNKGNSSSNPNSSSSSGGATFTGLTNGPIQQQVFGYLRKKGYSVAAAAGIMGNIQQESGFRPEAIEDNGEGHGLMQWSYDRKKDLFIFADSNGKQWSDPELQLEYFNKEMENGSIDKYFADVSGTVSAAGTSPIRGGLAEFKKQTDPGTAARLFEGAYERASKPMMEKRVAAAEAFNKEYGGKGGQGGGLDELFSNAKSSISSKIKGTMENGLSDIGSKIADSFSPKKQTATAPTQQKASSFTPKSPVNTGENTDLNHVTSPIQNATSDASSNDSKSITGNIEALLIQVIAELKNIGGHTANSSGQLESLNQKDFVDVGVRDSINQLGKVKPKKPQMPYSAGNVRAVNAIIRP